MGEMSVPAHVLYGASTQRAVLNFPISGRPVPAPIIKAYALIKAAAATVNRKLNRLDAPRANAIIEACHEIADGLTSFAPPGGGGRTGIETHFPHRHLSKPAPAPPPT